jgi:hypothetical protein
MEGVFFRDEEKLERAITEYVRRVTGCTKKMADEISAYCVDKGLHCSYVPDHLEKREGFTYSAWIGAEASDVDERGVRRERGSKWLDGEYQRLEDLRNSEAEAETKRKAEDAMWEAARQEAERQKRDLEAGRAERERAEREAEAEAEAEARAEAQRYEAITEAHANGEIPAENIPF